MRDLFLLGILLSYLFIGLRSPFVMALGYIWVDYMNPQHAGFSFLSRVPVALIMGIAAALSYIFMEQKRTNPRMVAALWLMITWALWMTLTTLWAEVPSAAWEKWDWAFKTICFAAFLPFLLKTRVHLEALLLTIALSIGAAAMAGAVKTLVSGGGYQIDLGLFRGNSGITESATFACLSVASIPILLYMHRSGIFFKNRQFSFFLFYGLSAASVVTCIGTFERTGLVSLAVLALLLTLTAKRKTFAIVAIGIAVLASGYFISSRWVSRMNTIQNFQADESAEARIQVWLWTLDYVGSHPLGGGFDDYLIDHISIKTPDSDEPIEQTGRAFHSIWFEVLGEQGIPGIILFIAMIATFYRNTFNVYRKTKRDEELHWATDLSRCMMMSTTIYLTGGTFIGIAFQPFLYDLFAASIILQQQLSRNAELRRENPLEMKLPAPQLL